MDENGMTTTKISSIEKENEQVSTYITNARLSAQPGQFIMVWLPGVGERPMGIAGTEHLTITVAHIGKFTDAMRKLKEGDLLSFRGPYGKGFTLPKKNDKILLAGGGTGIVPLYFLAKIAKRCGAKTTIVFGARTKDALFYEAKLKRVADELIITTDDGSKGIKGNVLAGIEDLKNFDRTYTCGPEKMMAAVVKKSMDSNVRCEASLERYMKCGFGICGSCMIGKYRVCADGPVFDGALLLKEPEFGKSKRSASGRKVNYPPTSR